MSRSKEPANPWYLLLAVVGVAFVLTAVCYALLVYRTQHRLDAASSPHALLAFLDRYGGYLLAGELVILAVATCGAIGLDDWRQRRRPPRP